MMIKIFAVIFKSGSDPEDGGNMASHLLLREPKVSRDSDIY
jgi:hypothetical protein